MSSTSSGGASVITLQFSLEIPLDVAEQEVQAAINAAGNLLPQRPAEAADLQQGQPGRHADPDARDHLEDAAAAQGPGPGRHARRAEDLADAGRRPGQHRRRPAAGGAHPGQSGGARRARPEPRDVRTAIGAANVNQAKGSFDGPTRASTHRRQRPAHARADEYRNLIIAYSNGAPLRLDDVADVIDGAENTPPRGLGQRHCRRCWSTSSASRAPTSSKSSTASRRCCRS